MKPSTFALSLYLILGLHHPAMGASHDSHSHQPSTSDAAPPAVHGMVIFGDDTIYASHIPMFMVPHDWQAHFEITFEHSAIDADAYFKNLSQGQGVQNLYTFAPKPFVLPDLLSGKISTFSGDLFEGNFEAGGKVILKDVSVHVTKIMNVSQLKKTTSVSPNIKYIAVGNSKRTFLAHKIVAPASFDQIVEVKWIKKFDQTPGEFLLDGSDVLGSRLKAGKLYKLVGNKLTLTTLDEEADLKVLAEFSCTIGPGFFEPCE